MFSTTRRCSAGKGSRKEALRVGKVTDHSQLLSVMASAPKSDWSAAGLVGWWLSLAPGWRHEDRSQLSGGCCDRAAVEWSADPCPLPADELRSSDAACAG